MQLAETNVGCRCDLIDKYRENLGTRFVAPSTASVSVDHLPVYYEWCMSARGDGCWSCLQGRVGVVACAPHRVWLGRFESCANCTHVVHSIQPPLRCKPQHVRTYDVCTSQTDNITANQQPRQVCLNACPATSSFAFRRAMSQSVVPQRFQFPDQLPLQYAETLGLLVCGNDERQRRTATKIL